MFAPDRMVAHNLNPRCPDGGELCGYMEREWNSTPHILGRSGKGKDKEPAKSAPAPGPLKTKIARPTKSRLRIPFL